MIIEKIFNWESPRFKRLLATTACLLLFLLPALGEEQDTDLFITRPPEGMEAHALRLKTNLLPWCVAIPNIGAEVDLADKWSVALNIWYCPWKLSDSFSIKTAAILPEARFWLRNTEKGSYFNLHLNLAWYNVRFGHRRYQDDKMPLLGAGIGYGYRLPIKKNWCLEFEIGAGMAHTRYNRYYNVKNGALIDTRKTTYWGLDRLGVNLVYYLCDL